MNRSETIQRLNTAAASREMDFAVAECLGMNPAWSFSTTKVPKLYSRVGGGPIPAWTASIERALALFEPGDRFLILDEAVFEVSKRDQNVRRIPLIICKYRLQRPNERAEWRHRIITKHRNIRA